MVSPFFKDIFREIKNTKARFFSLAVITCLGVALLVGIRATAHHMRDAADDMYRAANLYDIQIRSPRGFTNDDINTIRSFNGIHNLMPTYILDVYVEVGENLRTMRTYALPDSMNTLTLIEGRLPENPNEIAIEHRLLRQGRFAIGDTIYFDSMGILYDEFIITGVIQSPLYLTPLRGNTTLGTGTLEFSSYLHLDAFILPVYTDIYIIMEESLNMHTVSNEYNAKAIQWRNEIRQLLAEHNIEGFVFTRQNGVAFESFFQDSLRLQRVGYVFPMLFFLVAILVSLTAINRMVSEQRGQIGIYKALGYSPFAILQKYALYALFSSLIGSIIGAAIGLQVLTRIIFNAYGHLYSNMPYSNHPIIWSISAIAIFMAVGSLTLTAAITCFNTLRGEAAMLMRPKAPIAGKRVLLERIPLIWKRFGFISKLTMRNIFRYKRRFLMCLIGVAGCTSLLVMAFGLRDSIGNVARIQFREIVEYDYMLHLTDINEEIEQELIDLTPDSRLFIRTISADAFTDKGGFAADIVVPQYKEMLSDFINIEPLGIDGVIVTEKLADEMGVSSGDYFTITIGDGSSYTVRAAAIARNYVFHYIYMSPETYNDLFERDIILNGLFIIGDISLETVLSHHAVQAIVSTAFMLENLTEQTDALGIVTLVLLIMACLLAFVVLFNLTEINIIERMREIATIKVLGFFDIETAMYLYRENMIVTIMGIILGLFGGIQLNSFVLTTVEIDLLRFPHLILPSSFILAVVLSAIFAFIVNLATYHKLVSIDMVESLKSVE